MKIKEFAKVITGGTPSTKEKSYWENGKIPWLNSGELNQDFVTTTRNYITEAGLKSSAARLMPPDTVLIALTGATTGVVGYLAFEASANQSVTGILPSESHFPKYLYYYLKSIRQKVIDLSYGGAQNHISQGFVQNIEVPLPSLKEQQRIATILDHADSIRRKNKQILEKYNELAQSVFYEMFGDPVNDTKKWEKKRIKEIGKVLTGNTPPRKISDYYGDHIEWIKTDNINTPSLYLTKASEYLSEKGQKIGRIVNPGAILVTCIAGSRRVIGNASIANRKVAFNQQINALVPREDSSLFLYYNFIMAKTYVQSFSTDSMKGMISKSKFEQIEFISPPKSLQNKFSNFVLQIEEQKVLTLKCLEKSEELFQSLLQRAFKGEP